jgi:hypothetical protein
MGRVDYPCVAASLDGFVQQVAIHYLKHGYRYYVSGFVRENRRPEDIDKKLVEKYAVDIDKWSRHRRKRQGLANVQYIRHDRRFLLMATGPWGGHPFFEEEAEIRDAREVSIKIGGYELSYRGSRVWVRIERKRLKELRSYFLEVATKRRASELEAEFRGLPFEPYRPVRYQLFRLLEEVNALRKRAGGLAPVPESAVRFKRRVVEVFEGRVTCPRGRDGVAQPGD